MKGDENPMEEYSHEELKDFIIRHINKMSTEQLSETLLFCEDLRKEFII